MAFFSDQFLRGVLFFTFGGVSSVAILKIWENRESLLREIRRRFDSNKTRQPEEHDERFDWEGKSYVSYENILSKPNRIMVISEKLNDTHNQRLFRQQRTQNVSTTETVKADRVDILLCRRYLYRHFSVLSFFLIVYLILKKNRFIQICILQANLDRDRNNNINSSRNHGIVLMNNWYEVNFFPRAPCAR